MKTRTLILSVLLALAVSLSLPGLAQDNQQQTSDSPPQTSDNQQTNQQVSSPDQAQTTTQDQQKDQKEQKVKHGGKNDVDAIGNRKIGGMDWYSIEKEIRIGKEYAQQLEQSMRMVQDPVINEYVNRIGQNLVRNSDAKVPFTIKVLDDDQVNAFALPGGYFYVNTGLILAAQSEAELAGVMAHEIAHVAARHATKGATRSQIWNMASMSLIFVGGPVGMAVRQVTSLAVPMTFMKFSRNFEREADLLGIEYEYAAGYDPQAFVDFFERIASQRKNPNFVARAFDSHPMNQDRIRRAQKEISTMLPA